MFKLPDKEISIKKIENQPRVTGQYVVLQASAQMLNAALRDWGLQWVYDIDEAQRLVQTAGFCKCTSANFGESCHEKLKGLETREDSRIIFECIKTT